MKLRYILSFFIIFNLFVVLYCYNIYTQNKIKEENHKEQASENILLKNGLEPLPKGTIQASPLPLYKNDKIQVIPLKESITSEISY